MYYFNFDYSFKLVQFVRQYGVFMTHIDSFIDHIFSSTVNLDFCENISAHFYNNMIVVKPIQLYSAILKL